LPRKIGVMVILLFLTSTTCGCIDINLAKDLFFEEEEEVTFSIVDKATISHIFKTTSDPRSRSFDSTEMGFVKPDTQYLKFDMTVTIDEIPLERLREFIEGTSDDNRFVSVIIRNPEDEIVHTETYTVTDTIESLVFYRPISGLWQIIVSAEGIGSDLLEYYDTFTIVFKAKEPNS